MTCDVTRYSKKKYCISDFRHEITIKTIERNAGFGNNVVQDVLTTFNIFAIIQDYNGGNYTTIAGDSVDEQITHIIIIPYITELQSFIDNSRAYIIEYANKKYKIKDIKNENLDKSYIKIKVAIQ